MLDFILKLFIKDSGNISDAKVRKAYGTFAGIFGIITNLILFLLKLFIGLVSGSISIMADAVNNLADSGSSVLTIIGFKLSSKPADKDHPFGHERMEYLTGLCISVIILIVGFELLTESFSKLFSPELPNFRFLTFVILIISMIGKILQGLFYRKIGRKISSEALIASYTDSINDVISTTAVLISAFISFKFGIVLDGIIGIGVSVFIIYSGIKLTIETSNPLIGTVPKPETVKMISNKLLAYDIVLGIHDLVIHSYGANKCFATVHAEVDCESDITHVHDMIDVIERDFLSEMNIHLVIHMDPIVTNSPEVEKEKTNVMRVLKEISDQISMHDFRMVKGNHHTNLIFDVCIPYSFKMPENELKELIDKNVKATNNKLFTVITVDRDFTNSI